MRVLFINSVCGSGSTGKIALMQAKKMIDEGHEVLFAYGRQSNVPKDFVQNTYRITNNFFVYEHILETRLFDNHGFASRLSTKKFLKKADDFNPDMIWLHNLHGYYINVQLLFDWIKSKSNLIVFWTLHDCWAFTGHCAYFLYPSCDKWKSNCYGCVHKLKYPTTFLIGKSSRNYLKKKSTFEGVKNLSIITPSKWLANLVRFSYLNEYKVSVEYNKIDTEVFKPTFSKFKEKYKIEDKFIILGVANVWNSRKGYEDFLKLSELFLDNTCFQFIIVGLNEKQKKELPKNVLGFSRTESVHELVEMYTSSNVFFNPTYEDNFPTVNLEAEACGTCVLTYDTGGCSETIKRNDSKLIRPGDIDHVARILVDMFEAMDKSFTM